MLAYFSIGAAALFLCVVVVAGFYTGARHVEEMSAIVRNTDRPSWAQEPVDAFNRVVGRPTSVDPAAELYNEDDRIRGEDAEGEIRGEDAEGEIRAGNDSAEETATEEEPSP